MMTPGPIAHTMQYLYHRYHTAYHTPGARPLALSLTAYCTISRRPPPPSLDTAYESSIYYTAACAAAIVACMMSDDAWQCIALHNEICRIIKYCIYFITHYVGINYYALYGIRRALMVMRAGCRC